MRPKKSLGQNFLTSVGAREAIIRAAELTDPRTEAKPPCVLEIGPGKGFLTEALLQAVGERGKVVAVEKDDWLFDELTDRFQDFTKSGKLELIHGDILEISRLNLDGKYKLVANIPYYITGEIIRTFLETPPDGKQPEMMVLMVQKEVAERIIGLPRAKSRGEIKESILSISVKAYGEPKYVQTVKAGSFSPKPNVDSAILAIKNIQPMSRFNLDKEGEREFFNIVKKGFAHKRKLLRSNLGCSAEILEQGKIKATARAEELTLEQWLYLSKNL